MTVRYAVLLMALLPWAAPAQEVYATVTPLGGFGVYLVPDEAPKRQRPAQRRSQASPAEAAWVNELGRRPSAWPLAFAAPAKVNGDYQRQLIPAIARIAGQYRLDPRLVHALISAESAFDRRAVSPKGAMGLMQLMPATARRFGVSDPYDPVQNLKGGMAYLRWLLDFFQGNVHLALAAYNAGEGAVRRYGNAIPPYPETQRYVARVLAFYRYSQPP